MRFAKKAVAVFSYFSSLTQIAHRGHSMYEQGSDLIDLRLTWKETENFIYEDFWRIFEELKKIFGDFLMIFEDF